MRSSLIALAWFTSLYCISQVPLINYPGLTSITFYEQTGGMYSHTYGLNDAALTTHVTGQLNGNRDFEGWPGNEFYDVFYSNADGTFNINGGYVSIECQFDMNSGGGGLNINEVEFHFASGNSIYGSYITSYVANGSNYLPGSQKRAADCNLATFSTMGNTENTSMKLRLTIGMLNSTSTIIEKACSGSGFEVSVGNSIFNEANPVGTVILTANNGCDSLVYVDLTFNEIYFDEINYMGCRGDGYSILVGNTLYDESNPSGVEVLMSQGNCDSTIVVDLFFHHAAYNEINYKGCKGDGYSLNVNLTEYSESNPSGIEIMQTADGCDSIIQISLIFEECIDPDLDCAIYIPNVISPNDDGINDEFGFSFDTYCKIKHFRVALFDRWGEELYYSEDPAFKWNGDFKGKQLQPGIMVYSAEIYFEGSSKTVIKRGDLTLIR